MALSQLDSFALAASVVVAAKNQISSDLAGEAIILDFKSGIYYGLNEVGARIWGLIQQPMTLTAIRNTVLQEYEVEPDIFDRDLLSLLKQLEAAGLVEVCHEATL